jgi:putative ATP-dependent endonuclease of the OLD family
VYISKLFAKNFRSLKQTTVQFANGKNVIVGKNNSGKSNIIKAIEILIGEKHPSYINFTDNDFYTIKIQDDETGEFKEKVAENFYLEVEIEGRDFEEATILSMRKKSAFSKLKSISELYKKNPETGQIIINYDLVQGLEDADERNELAVLYEYKGKAVKTKWYSGEELLQAVKSAKKIKLFFSKSRLDDDSSGYGIIFQESNDVFWISQYMPKKFRESLITTTVISALRSQKEDLRLNYYTWFGKLISNLWNANKGKVDVKENKTYEDLIKEQSLNIKGFVDIVFEENTVEMRTLLESAIAHKSVSFKFLSDSKLDLYKNIQIFVDDGIDRPLNEKGTGIQSAVIIALFSQYCNKFHNRSSLLIAEEPELYLHPQARRVISAELNKYIQSSINQERQLIISTHSTEYLRNVDPKCIVRVFKDDLHNCSIVAQLKEDVANEITKEIQRFIWSANTEMFFADKVVLVEGGEVYLLPSIIDKLTGSNQKLDYENYSIARVNGKGNFLTYVKMLDNFKIDWIVLGDLDCYRDELSKLYKYLEFKEFEKELSLIKIEIKKSATDFSKIKERIDNIDKNFDAKQLQNVFEKFEKGTIDNTDEELLSTITYMRERHVKIDTRKIILDTIGEERFIALQAMLRQKGIFIWSFGEIENYYSDTVVQMKGTKDTKALELSYLIVDNDNGVEDFLQNLDEIKELVQLILAPLERYMI